MKRDQTRTWSEILFFVGVTAVVSAFGFHRFLSDGGLVSIVAAVTGTVGLAIYLTLAWRKHRERGAGPRF